LTLVVAWACLLVCTLLVAVALPLPVRIAICVCAATGAGSSLQSVFLHRGSNAIRALVWTDKGQMTALLESGQTGYPVTVRPGSFRLGRHGVLLWLDTGEHRRAVFVDAGSHEVRAYRSLCRRLNGAPGRFPGEPEQAS
jgi:hypothetical protein